MLRIILFIAIVLVASCQTRDRIEKSGENWAAGTVQFDGRTDSIFFHDCYCNLLDKAIVLNHVHFGLHGGSLKTRKYGDSVQFSIDDFAYDFHTFSFKRKDLKIDQPNPMLGETITGSIALVGESRGRQNEVYTFNLTGRFNCILRDSTYDYQAFYDGLLNRLDSIEMVKLGRIALTNPDSITELQLGYRNFYLVKGELHFFKNLRRLSLSQFPIIDDTMISNFKSLEELQIDSDSLTELPSSIAALKELKVLRVSAPITSISEDLYGLTKLRTLDLGGTKISAISSRIENLADLETLNIDCTEMTRIPTKIFKLRKLTDLALPDSLIPFKIDTLDLTSIRTLHVSYAFLLYNKKALGKLEHLEWLYPSFEYSSHEEYMHNYYKQKKWLENKLPNVEISGTTYVHDWKNLVSRSIPE